MKLLSFDFCYLCGGDWNSSQNRRAQSALTEIPRWAWLANNCITQMSRSASPAGSGSKAQPLQIARQLGGRVGWQGYAFGRAQCCTALDNRLATARLGTVEVERSVIALRKAGLSDAAKWSTAIAAADVRIGSTVTVEHHPPDRPHLRVKPT